MPVQLRSRRTREALVAAGEHEFSRRGYAAATSKSIAVRAGVATGSFYQYFPDKDALLREIARVRQERVAFEVLALVDVPAPSARNQAPSPVELETRLRKMVALVMRVHRDDPGLHAVLTERRHADPELHLLISEAERILCDRVAIMLGRWGYRGDRRAAAFVLMGMVEGAVHAHVLGQPMVSDARFTSALGDALLRVATGR
jgi:AcrR family transcriptional regulator